MGYWTRVMLAALLVGGVGAVGKGDAAAQQLGGMAHAGTDVLSVTGSVGGFFPVSEFDDGTSFDTGLSLGGAATYWVHHFLGLRANLLYTSVDVSVPDDPADAGGVLQDGDPSIIHYSGDALVRLPLPGGQTVSWFPYGLLGLGAKHYRFEETEQLQNGTLTDFAFNIGAGVEIRWGDMGRWGVHTEIRDFVSPFDLDDEAADVDATLQDLVWTAGISVNF